MYEGTRGAGRLIDALDRLKHDPDRLDQLADLLYYYPDQLEQDITATVDLYAIAKTTETKEKD